MSGDGLFRIGNGLFRLRNGLFRLGGLEFIALRIEMMLDDMRLAGFSVRIGFLGETTAVECAELVDYTDITA